MIRAIITTNSGKVFQGSFETQELATDWVKSHKRKGKDAFRVSVAKRPAGAEVIETVKGPLGDMLLVEFPAEYTVEYIDEVLHNRVSKMDDLRRERNKILCATDFLFVSDFNLPQDERVIYRTYRQMLRDLPSKITESEEILFEKFEAWLRRTHYTLFYEAGKGPQIVKRFNTYLE